MLRTKSRGVFGVGPAFKQIIVSRSFIIISHKHIILMVDTSVVIIYYNPDLPDPHHGVEVREESVGKIGMVEGQP